MATPVIPPHFTQKQSPWGQSISASHYPHPYSHSNHSPSSTSSISSISSLSSPNTNAHANNMNMNANASRCLEITVTNAVQTPEAFLQSLEASSGRVQRAAIQYLSNISIEDVDAKAQIAYSDRIYSVHSVHSGHPAGWTNRSRTGVNEDANEAIQAIQANQTSEEKETAARSQGQHKRMWKMKVEFTTVQAATQAISRLRLNGVNDIINNRGDNNENVQRHLLAQGIGRGIGRGSPQSVELTSEAVRTVEPKEEVEVEIGVGIETINDNTLKDVEAIEAVEAVEAVVVQPLSGFILDDNDHLLHFRGLSASNSPTSPWGTGNAPSPPSTASKIDGGYGDSRLSPRADKLREDGQNSQTAPNHIGASINPINTNINDSNLNLSPDPNGHYIGGYSSLQRDAVITPFITTSISTSNFISPSPSLLTSGFSASVAATDGNEKGVLSLGASTNMHTSAMTNMIANHPNKNSYATALTITSANAGSAESEDFSSSSATPSTASSDRDMDNNSHSRRESWSSFVFSPPSDSSPSPPRFNHQLMDYTSKLFPSIGMGASAPTAMNMGSGVGAGVGATIGTGKGLTHNMWSETRTLGTSSGASHTPSSSLSSLSSIHNDQYDQYQYQYDPYGHYEYDAFDDEFDQVVALGLDLSRLEVIDPSSQRTPTEWRARDNIFTSYHLDPWAQPISKPQSPQNPVILSAPNMHANINAKPYAGVATTGITRTGTVIVEPERSPLPYIQHPKIPQSERKSVQPLTPITPPSSQPQQQQQQKIAVPQQKQQTLSSPQYSKVVQAGNSPRPRPVSPATGFVKAEGLVKPGHGLGPGSGSGSGPNRKNPAGHHRPTYSTSTNYSRHSDTSNSSNSSSPNQNHKASSYNYNKQPHPKPSHDHDNSENGSVSGSNSGSGGKYHKSRQDKRLYAADPHVGPRPTDWMLSDETKKTRAIRDARFAQIVSMGLAPGRTKAGWAQARRPGKRDRDAAKARLRALEEEKEREMLRALLDDGSNPNLADNAPLPLQPQTA